MGVLSKGYLNAFIPYLCVIRHKHVLGVRKNVQKIPYMDFPLGLRTYPWGKSLSSDFLGLCNNSQ